MIECLFTIDYEIYGNGEGSLGELVYEPAEKLKELFLKWNARFICFVEAAEIELIDALRSDPDIDRVKQQVHDLFNEGFEIGLHLHPQWYNARYENGRWLLDYREYNLCTQPRQRIVQMVDRSIAYFRKMLGVPGFTPFSFRAGNWLLQPTAEAAKVLAEHGIRVDSSVFKGGLQRQQGLDYRRAEKNGYYWKFTEDVNRPDPNGALLELPIYTDMVPFWRMATAKRIRLQQKRPAGAQPGEKRRIGRTWDFLRFRYPLKFDFCRMTAAELIAMIDQVIREDRQNPKVFRPIVAIGHTKDLYDLEAVDTFLSYLNQNGIPVSTFQKVHDQCLNSGEA